jgi:hypothetical protein
MTQGGTPDITVYGATGYTGGLICRELARRDRPFAAAGRSFESLQRLSSDLGVEFGLVPTLRQATVDDSKSLEMMLRETDVLINCAGPFMDLGPPVATAAMRTGTHYVDTTGEQRYLRWLRDELVDEAAEHGVVMMPACAYEYATGMIAADLAVEQGARDIAVCYGSADFSTSAGTKKSVVRSIAEAGYTYRHGKLIEQATGETIYDIPYPDGGQRTGGWIPGGEPIILPQFYDVESAESCILIDERLADWMSRLSGVMRQVARLGKPLADRLVEWLENRGEEGGEEELSPFQVLAFDTNARRWHTSIRGDDPYRATARMAVEAADRLAGLDAPEGGLQAPPTLFDSADFAESVDLEVEVANRDDSVM